MFQTIFMSTVLNCCLGQGQIDSEQGSKIFTEVLSHQSPNIKNMLTVFQNIKRLFIAFYAAASTDFFQK